MPENIQLTSEERRKFASRYESFMDGEGAKQFSANALSWGYKWGIEHYTMAEIAAAEGMTKANIQQQIKPFVLAVISDE